MGGPGPLLQIIQPAAPRHAPLQSVIHKIKQPPQILPKPPGPTQLGQINFKNAQAAHQNALLFNQVTRGFFLSDPLLQVGLQSLILSDRLLMLRSDRIERSNMISWLWIGWKSSI